jgi:WD40 repeat protein
MTRWNGLAIALFFGLALAARADDALPAGVLAKLAPPEAGVHPACVQFSPDGAVLAVVIDKKVHVWDASTWKEARSFDMKDACAALAWAPDGKTFAWIAGAAARGEKAKLAVTIHDATSGEEKLALLQSDATAGCPVNQLLFTPDGKRLLACGERSSTGPIIWGWDLPAGGPPDVYKFAGQGDGFRTFALSPDGKMLVASTDKSCELVEIEVSGADVKEVVRLDSQGKVRHIAFAPDGKTFATCGNDRPVVVHDLAAQKRLAEFGQKWASCVVYLADGTLVSSDKEQVCLWDPAANKCKGIYGVKGKADGAEPANNSSAGAGAETGTSVSPSGKQLAFGVDLGECGNVVVFDVGALK